MVMAVAMAMVWYVVSLRLRRYSGRREGRKVNKYVCM